MFDLKNIKTQNIIKLLGINLLLISSHFLVLGSNPKLSTEFNLANTVNNKSNTKYKKTLPVGIVIIGTVVNEKNVQIEGVTIFVKNGSTNTTTDKEGKFSIKVKDKNAVLIFTSINYEHLEKVIGESTTLNIILKETASSLNEVVVIGYGTQKKINVTGAVSTITGTSLADEPVTNITNALIGNATGISGLQASGEPGHNSTAIYIRGISSFNTAGASPLVVIDGIEQPAEQPMAQLDAMDANEIESISILKDAASSAVYGIRGANGVIVVTTKKGTKGKQVVSASTNFGTTKATNLVKTVNSYENAIMQNEAIGYQNEYYNNTSFNSFIFTDEELWKFKNDRDYTPTEVAAMNITDAQKAQLNQSPAIWYGSRDLMKEEFGGTGSQQQLNLNIRGGTEKLTYFTSVGYFSQGSILGNTTFEDANTASTFNRYNFRANMDIHPFKNLDINISSAGQFGITSGPEANISVTNDYQRYKNLFGYVQGGTPYVVPTIIDGHLISDWGGIAGTPNNPLGIKKEKLTNPGYVLLTSGQGIAYNTLITNTIQLVHKLTYITPGLTFRGSISYEDNYNKIIIHNPTVPSYTVTRDAVNPNIFDFYGGVKKPDNLNVNAGSTLWYKTYLDAGFDYIKSFQNHKLTALLLGKASVYNMPTDNYHTPSGIEGLVARITDNYLKRYMAELDLGYNGTEQFAPGKRFGLFPAISGGWLLSDEKFFPRTSWIDYLKIRASFGIVGSDNLGGRRFLYQPTAYLQGQIGYNLGSSNGSSVNPTNVGGGSVESYVGNPNVTWETAKKTNIGVESNLFDNHIVFSTDVFFDRRDHILTTLGIIPSTIGIPLANMPPENVGIVTNHGYELSLAWNDHVEAINYSIKGNLSYTRNKIIYKAEAPNPYPWMNVTGFSIGQYSGLKSDGLYNTPLELINRPYNTLVSNQEGLGDIKYKDINGDGVIDNKDVVPIGYSNLPQYAYNFNFRLTYKSFDFSMLINGTLKGSFYLNSFSTSSSPGMEYQFQYDERWTPEKAAAGIQATYPKSQFGLNASNSAVSDYWLKSNDFLKIKNIVFGYTLTAQKLKHAGINITSVRIYGNANNVFTFKNALTKYGYDPETTDQGSPYIFPLTRSFIVGANILF